MEVNLAGSYQYRTGKCKTMDAANCNFIFFYKSISENLKAFPTSFPSEEKTIFNQIKSDCMQKKNHKILIKRDI